MLLLIMAQDKQELMDLYRLAGSLEQKNKELTKQKQDFCNLQEEFAASLHLSGSSLDNIFSKE